MKFKIKPLYVRLLVAYVAFCIATTIYFHRC